MGTSRVITLEQINNSHWEGRKDCWNKVGHWWPSGEYLASAPRANSGGSKMLVHRWKLWTPTRDRNGTLSFGSWTMYEKSPEPVTSCLSKGLTGKARDNRHMEVPGGLIYNLTDKGLLLIQQEKEQWPTGKASRIGLVLPGRGSQWLQLKGRMNSSDLNHLLQKSLHSYVKGCW